MKMKKCHAKWYIHIYKPDPQRKPQQQQMSTGIVRAERSL